MRPSKPPFFIAALGALVLGQPWSSKYNYILRKFLKIVDEITL